MSLRPEELLQRDRCHTQRRGVLRIQVRIGDEDGEVERTQQLDDAAADLRCPDKAHGPPVVADRREALAPAVDTGVAGVFGGDGQHILPREEDGGQGEFGHRESVRRGRCRDQDAAIQGFPRKELSDRAAGVEDRHERGHAVELRFPDARGTPAGDQHRDVGRIPPLR